MNGRERCGLLGILPATLLTGPSTCLGKTLTRISISRKRNKLLKSVRRFHT